MVKEQDKENTFIAGDLKAVLEGIMPNRPVFLKVHGKMYKLDTVTDSVQDCVKLVAGEEVDING